MQRIDEPNRKGLDYFLVERKAGKLDEKSLDVIDNLRRAPSSINTSRGGFWLLDGFSTFT